MESFLRILGILFKALLTALLVFVTGLIAYYGRTASEPKGGWIVPTVSLAVLCFSLAALWNLGPTRKLWESAFKLLITAVILGLIWIILQSAYVRGDMREWYGAAVFGTTLLLLGVILWPRGNSLFFEKSWSGLLVALLFAWGFALLPWLVERMPWSCGGYYAWPCELLNELHAVAGPWPVLAVYFLVAVTLINVGLGDFLKRRKSEHRESN
jgi:hypothetical protein